MYNYIIILYYNYIIIYLLYKWIIKNRIIITHDTIFITLLLFVIVYIIWKQKTPAPQKERNKNVKSRSCWGQSYESPVIHLRLFPVSDSNQITVWSALVLASSKPPHQSDSSERIFWNLK